MKKTILGFALVGALSGAAGFAAAADPATKTSAPSVVSHEDREFFQKAAQTGMLEMQAASLATSRAMTPDTKTFASTMATEHAANNEELKTLATSKGVTLPTQLDRKHRGILKELQKEDPKEFDEKYAKTMNEGHEEAVKLFTETAKDSKDAEIRAYASDTLPALLHHLDMAKHLNGKS